MYMGAFQEYTQYPYVQKLCLTIYICKTLYKNWYGVVGNTIYKHSTKTCTTVYEQLLNFMIDWSFLYVKTQYWMKQQQSSCHQKLSLLGKQNVEKKGSF